jgi:hypothetical protein
MAQLCARGAIGISAEQARGSAATERCCQILEFQPRADASGTNGSPISFQRLSICRTSASSIVSPQLPMQDRSPGSSVSELTALYSSRTIALPVSSAGVHRSLPSPRDER